jgi:hypothetical protein
LSFGSPNLTWQFELRLPDPDRWVPLTTDMTEDDYGHAGAHEMVDIWQDADEAAPRELDDVLVDLVEIGHPLGVTGARIVVWDDIGIDGDPACVLEATPNQIAAARLAHAARQVQHALHGVELARTEVRAQIVKAATEDRLGRNMIARQVSGALTRRLVLQLLAGYDLVEAVREGLPTWSKRYRRWYPKLLSGVDNEYVGPFCYGPLMLELEADGQVYLHLVDIDGPEESDTPLGGDDTQGAGVDYYAAQAERARGYAEETVPLLTKAGFGLHRGDSAAASIDDVAQAITPDNRILISDT